MLRQQQSKKLGEIGRPRNCGKRHTQSSRYRTSSLLTRFSTWLSRWNISRFVSFISVCSVSRLVAICSTALVRRITAAAASSLRRENPNSPLAAQLMAAPAIAAKTSITAQAGGASILAPWYALRFGWCCLLIKLCLQPLMPHKLRLLLASTAQQQLLAILRNNRLHLHQERECGGDRSCLLPHHFFR